MSELVRIDGNGIFIDCPKEKFGSFIIDLLQAPRSIDGALGIVFDLNLFDLIDIIELIRQRVSEQHENSLVSFLAVVTFRTGRRVRIHGLDDFQSFTNIGSELADRISIEMIFLVKFPDSDTPKKQTVFVSFVTEKEAERKVRKRTYSDRFFDDKKSYIYFDIGHTHVSFGEDMANLLEKKLRSLELTDLNTRFWSYWLVEYLFLIFTLILILSGMVFVGSIVSDAAFRASEIIDFSSSFFLHVLGGCIVSLIVTAVIVGFVSRTLYEIFSKPRPSFLRLSDRATKVADTEIQSYKRRPYFFMIYSLTVIGLGVIASLIAAGIIDFL